jgi:UTP:GlnB (protein PII) uridylyltransferase
MPGSAAAQELSDFTDEAVLALTGTAPLRARTRYAVFALGGYGARRLLPGSDIDLLIVSGGDAGDMQPLVRTLLYPLWDTGVEVGHQVRTRSGQVRAVSADVTAATAFLTARFLAGDDGLARRVMTDVFKRLRRDRHRLLDAMSARVRTGSPYLLAPDLKEGAGGQRDIDELVWRAALKAQQPLTEVPGDITLTEAQDAITAARWRLHRHRPTARNLMSVADAEASGIDADATQRALAAVQRALLDTRDAQRPGGGASDEVSPAPLELADLVRAASEGPSALPRLERAAYAGGLDRAAPGFPALMTLRRPGLSHRYTVGAHSLHTLVSLFSGEHTTTETALPPEMLGPLVVAALTHDIGKRVPGPDHAERGAHEAGSVAARLGLSPDACRTVEMLVRGHLLLGEIATSRDLGDEDVVLEAAARIGDRDLVEPLFLLTAADVTATGPDVWTPWRRSLVTELARKIEAALSPGVDGTGIVSVAHACRDEAIRLALAEGASRAVLSFIESAPLRYLARRTPGHVLREGRLVQSLSGPGVFGEVALDVRAGDAPGTWLLDIATRDRPGLFATIAGAVAISGLDTLGAEAFTSHRGVALDTFVVAPSTAAPVDARTWQTLERHLSDAVSGRVGLEPLLEGRRRHYRTSSLPDDIECSVTVGPCGPFSSSVHVRAHDRIGLLHDLAFAIQRAGFDIRHAVVTTRSGVADDVFDLTDATGSPPRHAVLETTLVPLLTAAAETGPGR